MHHWPMQGMKFFEEKSVENGLPFYAGGMADAQVLR